MFYNSSLPEEKGTDGWMERCMYMDGGMVWDGQKGRQRGGGQCGQKGKEEKMRGITD